LEKYSKFVLAGKINTISPGCIKYGFSDKRHRRAKRRKKPQKGPHLPKMPDRTGIPCTARISVPEGINLAAGEAILLL